MTHRVQELELHVRRQRAISPPVSAYQRIVLDREEQHSDLVMREARIGVDLRCEFTRQTEFVGAHLDDAAGRHHRARGGGKGLAGPFAESHGSKYGVVDSRVSNGSA